MKSIKALTCWKQPKKRAPKKEVDTIVLPDINGKNFVLTGTFWTTRSELETLIHGCGGIVQAGIRVNTHYLAVGANPGARKLQQYNKQKKQGTLQQINSNILRSALDKTREGTLS